MNAFLRHRHSSSSAAMAAATGFAGIAIFQLVLAFGAPVGHAAWGGAHAHLSTAQRSGSAAAVVIWTAAALIVLGRAGFWGTPKLATLFRWGTWFLAGVSALAAVLNFASQSRWENLIFGPLALLLAIFCSVLARGSATDRRASAAMNTKSADLAATPPGTERRPRRSRVVYAAPLRSSRSGLRLAQAALLVGLLHGAVLVYWGVGGTWLLDTIGGSLEEKGRAGNAGVMLAVWAAVVLVIIASVLPLLALRRLMRPAWNRIVWRLAWTAAAILTLYGLVWTAAGLLAEAGVIPAPANADDRRALAWHAYLWDPWFLIWGLLVAAALLRGRQRPSPPATTADRARRLPTRDQHNKRAGEGPFLHDHPAAHESRARLRDRPALRA